MYMDVLVTVGEFSRMSHLSVKALRHYHEIGLLEPADVDPVNGYRRYTTGQVPTAQLIRRFRDLEMPLEEVRAVLEAPDPAARDRTILEHLARMERRLEETQATVASLRMLLDEGRSPMAVGYRTAMAAPTLAISEVVGFDDAETWLGAAYPELEHALGATGSERAGADGALYSEAFFEAGAGEVVAFVPVAATSRVTPIPHGGRVHAFEVPAGRARGDAAPRVVRRSRPGVRRARHVRGCAIAGRARADPGALPRA